MSTPAYLQIYTGNGKGKTTAALGLALRAAGAGQRSLIVQFMKGSFPYSEHESLKRWRDQIRVETFGSDRFVLEKRQPTDDEKDEIRAGLTRAREAYGVEEFEILILDEICVAVHFGAIEESDVISLMKDRPPTLELILTGRYCPKAWYDYADLVTEMHEVKHYYQQGILSRKGIDS